MLSKESLKKIEYELTKYPADQRRAAVMSALRIAQAEKGWLSKEVITFIADIQAFQAGEAPMIKSVMGLFLIFCGLPFYILWRKPKQIFGIKS